MRNCRKKVVIVGGGFGGLTAAQELKESTFEITIIDKTNHHLFQPLLYQVATADIKGINFPDLWHGLPGRLFIFYS